MIKTARWLTLVLTLGLLVCLLGVAETRSIRPMMAAKAGLPAQGLNRASASGSPVGDNFVISGAPEQEVHPAVAYNSDREEYLAVWYNDRAECDDIIRAQRVSKNGTLVDGAFDVSAGCSDDRSYPDVAYNGQHGEYLVVWEHHDGLWYNIRARRVSGTGQVLDTTDIDFVSGSNIVTPTNPAVSYAYTSDRYLVVWEESFPITTSIVGQVVSSSGSLDGNTFIIFEDPSGSPQREPDLAYNRSRDEYLVVWQQQDQHELDWDIYARLVAGDGTRLQPASIEIDRYRNDEFTPSIAAIPTQPDQGQYLVVWELRYVSGETTDGDIWGQQVAGDGTTGSSFKISDAPEDQTIPAVAGNESAQQYLVVWTHSSDSSTDIHARAVSMNGDLVGQESAFVGGRSYPDHAAVASGWGNDFMVAFDDSPFTPNSNIYGRLWREAVYLPLVLRTHP